MDAGVDKKRLSIFGVPTGGKTARWLLVLWVIVIILLLVFLLIFYSQDGHGPIFPIAGSLAGGISSVSIVYSALYLHLSVTYVTSFIF